MEDVKLGQCMFVQTLGQPSALQLEALDNTQLPEQMAPKLSLVSLIKIPKERE